LIVLLLMESLLLKMENY